MAEKEEGWRRERKDGGERGRMVESEEGWRRERKEREGQGGTVCIKQSCCSCTVYTPAASVCAGPEWNERTLYSVSGKPKYTCSGGRRTTEGETQVYVCGHTYIRFSSEGRALI